MLLCGFESFKNIFVRIDILERLFIMILNSNKDKFKNNKEIKLTPEMLNLLGCSKENFLKLLKNMNYKIFNKDNEVFFKYLPEKTAPKKGERKLYSSDNPFSKLINFNIKQ